MGTQPGPSAEELFAEFVNGQPPHAALDFEALFAAHPQHAVELRELRQAWDGLAGLLRQLGVGASLEERLAQRFGTAARTELALDAESGSDTVTEELDELAGRRAFGRYRIKDAVGMGGMGVVVRVWDDDLKRHLAMKLTRESQRPTSEARDSRRLARFLEEARLTAQLDHPCIVPVHELGIDPGGRVYFTMKLVTGTTLTEAFVEHARGEARWTTARLLSAILRVCEAMGYAHARGVVHRDLKPDNVMVGEFGEVYVMDWGLARLLERSDREADALPAERHSPVQTQEGDVIGTPAYMPPEQALGERASVGTRSDVYAVGAMLYHLLAGHAPYLEPGSSTDRLEVWSRVRREPPRPLEQAAPDAAAELVAICEKAMERDPARRYGGMGELARDLSNYLEGRVVAAFGGGAWAEARKWVRRNRGLAAALGGFVLALAAGLAASGTLYVRAERRADDVLRLSALQELDDLLVAADELWPPHPESIVPCEQWLARARALLAGLDGYEVERGELARRIEGGETSVQARWWHQQLSLLLAGLEALERELVSSDAVTEARGWSVGRRLAFARGLGEALAAGGELAEAWARALPQIEDEYPGLGLVPQAGLLPLGPDPESGLWEFAHLMSGAPPERRVEGRWSVEEGTGIVLVLVPAGSFWMGAQGRDPLGRNFAVAPKTDESPVHEVELSAFFIGKHEVTQGQWARLTGAHPSRYVDPPLVQVPAVHPVEQVSWVRAREVLWRAGLNLPSEAQWEYAARGGTDTAWWTGEVRETLADPVAANLVDGTAARYGVPWPNVNDWVELEDGWVVHAPVDALLPNPFGLHHVLGNVIEWCLDGYFEDYYGRSPRREPVAPLGESPSRALRGGGFTSVAWSARCATRGDYSATVADGNVGVRAARAIQR